MSTGRSTGRAPDASAAHEHRTRWGSQEGIPASDGGSNGRPRRLHDATRNAPAALEDADTRALRIGRALVALADALGLTAVADVEPRDELVAICAEGLEPYGLELRAVQTLIAEGRLRAVQIGRRRFTKRSYLLALVDELETEQPAPPRGQPVDVL